MTSKVSQDISQLKTTIARILLEKNRQPCTTCCELFSHSLIFVAIILGFLFSSVRKQPEMFYDKAFVTIPPTFMRDDTTMKEKVFGFNQLVSGPLVIPDLDEYISLGNTLRRQFGDDDDKWSTTDLKTPILTLLDRGPLLFAPAGENVNQFITFLNQTYEYFSELQVEIYPDETSALKRVGQITDQPMFALIILREITPTKVSYLIRQDGGTTPNTNELIIYPSVGLPRDYQTYLIGGYLTLKKAVEAWLNEKLAIAQSPYIQCKLGPPEVALIPFPTFPYDFNPFYSQVGFVLAIALMMSSIYPVSKFAKNLVYEKETKLRDLMLTMGLKPWIYGMGWCLVSIVIFLWISITSTILACTTFLGNSNPVLVFFLFLLFALSELALIFLLSALFTHATSIGIFTPIFIVLLILPRFMFLSVKQDEEVVAKWVCSLLSPTAFAFGVDKVIEFENAGIGIQWFNVEKGIFNFASCLLMLSTDTCLYCLIGLLISMKSEILGYFRAAEEEPVEFEPLSPAEETDNFERFEGFQGKVTIHELKKVYGRGNTAVDGFSIKLYQDQITCLLGHNGAGM
jgi:ABC-type multidrug transport system fused ATPase/permease subunit